MLNYLLILLAVLFVVYICLSIREHIERDNQKTQDEQVVHQKEGFAAANELGFSNEYRFIEEKGYTHPINQHQLKQLMFHTRNPEIIKQRYTYQDGSLGNYQANYYAGVPGAAYLRNLAVDYDPTIDPQFNRNKFEVIPQQLPPPDGDLNRRISCCRKLADLPGYDVQDPQNLSATTVISREAELQRNLMEERRDERNYVPTDNLAYSLEEPKN